VKNSPCSWVLSAAFPCVSQTDVILTWHLTWHSSHWKVKTLTVSLIHFIFPIRFLLFLFCIFQPCHFCLEVSLELSIYVYVLVGEGVGGSKSVNGSRKTTTKRRENESEEELEICNRIAIKKCHFDTCQLVFKWTFPPLLLMGHISLFFVSANKNKQSRDNIAAKCQSLLKT